MSFPKGLLLIAAFMAGCASAEQNTKTWDVKVSTPSKSRVWVQKNDGSRQCGEAPASMGPEAAAKAAKSKGLVVFDFRQGHDGQMRPAVCGAPTGNTVELLISSSDIGLAGGLGFYPKPTNN